MSGLSFRHKTELELIMILVTGVSAVGKTHMINHFVEQHPYYMRLTASQALREAGRPVADLDRQTALNNQLMLPHLLRPRDGLAAGRLILDGHAAIETMEGAVPVPDEVVEQLPLSAILLVVDAYDRMATRRQAKGRPTDPALLQRLQELERNLSLRWAAALAVPFREIRSGDHERFQEAVLPA